MSDNELASKGAVTVGSLLKYFMNLYKTQLGLPRDADSRIVTVEPSRQYPKLTTYELFVEYKGESFSRRVTLGPIAEESGSKSSCFLAIYDSKLVIKIPPKAITDFEEYIHAIERDRKIVARLSPQVCLIPGVSMILDKIYKFPRINELRGNQREDAYFEWLNYNKEYQWYLKIDGSFAFFMDLSKHMFLSDLIPLFHGTEIKIYEEMTRDPSVLDIFERFEGRYGIERAHIGVELKGVYKKFYEAARQQMTKAEAGSSDMLYRLQYWFFHYISGRPLRRGDQSITATQADEYNRILETLVEENRGVVDEYRYMIVDFLKGKGAFLNQRYKEGVVVNIMEILANVKDKGVAVRDIKPDNMLVAGDMDNYPAFLATPERFSIGLIDFETSVVFGAADPEEMEQPFLGGTSLYATPLHMFNNKVLLSLYKDLPRAFYLQDWYSTAAMIYRIITGDQLFSKTSKLFTVTAGKLKDAKKANRPAETVVSEINGLFWKRAVTEFNANLEAKRDMLKFLRPALGEMSRRMCLDEMNALNTWLDEEIKRLGNSLSLFKSQEHREQLYAVTPEQLEQLIKKAQEGAGVGAQPVAQMKQIRDLKKELLNNKRIFDLIATGSTDFSVYDLLVFMFNRVVAFMNINPMKRNESGARG